MCLCSSCDFTELPCTHNVCQTCADVYNSLSVQNKKCPLCRDLLNIQTKQKLATDIKQAIREHAECLIEKIKSNEKVLIQTVENWERCLSEKKEKLSIGVNDRSLTNGPKSQGQGHAGSVSAFDSHDCLRTEVEFVAEDGIKVGQVHVITSPQNDPEPVMPAVVPSTAPGTQPFDGTRPKQKVAPLIVEGGVDLTKRYDMKFQKGGLRGGRDVVFTPKGDIVVCDRFKRHVIMYNNDGEVLTTSTEQGVKFGGKPWGLLYDPHESTVIVTDTMGYLTFLSDTDLKKVRSVRLEGTDEAHGIGLLSDGCLVVGTAGRKDAVSIYDRQLGRRQRYINAYHYGDQEHNVTYPWYITVLPDDTIVVAMLGNNHVVYLSTELECLQLAHIRDPLGVTLSPQDGVLVAGQIPDSVHHLWGKIDNIQQTVIMEFTEEDEQGCAFVEAIAMWKNQLAVLFDYALRVYQWE